MEKDFMVEAVVVDCSFVLAGVAGDGQRGRTTVSLSLADAFPSLARQPAAGQR